MTELELKNLVEKLILSCPDYEITIFQTKCSNNVFLLVVKDSREATDIDDWSVEEIYPLQADIITPLLKKENHFLDIRQLFTRENQFVFYTTWGSVFNKIKTKPWGEWYEGGQYTHFVGESEDINSLISYLTETENLLF